MARYNELGEEIPDDTPVEVPLRLRLPMDRTAEIRQAVRQAVSEMASKQGFETFAEADDFDVPDGDEVELSGYQASVMRIEEASARDRDSEMLDQLSYENAARRSRVRARLIKEGRSDEDRSFGGGRAEGGKRSADAGKRSEASGGPRHGGDGARGDAEGGGGSGGVA